jgi:hypothetical protein
MNARTLFSLAVVALGTGATLSTTAAPASAAPGAAPFTGRSFAHAEPDKKQKPLLYVADNANNQISVFDVSKKQSSQPVQVITQGLSGPQGITTDLSGNLYVANLYGASVSVYAPGQSAPFRTLSTDLNTPTDVRVDSSGDVYVANDPGFGSPGYIVEFLAGQSSPSNVWYTPAVNTVISGFALLNPSQPGSTSIYAAGYTESPSGLASGFVLSCYPGNPTCVNIGDSFGQTGGVAVEESPGNQLPFDFLVIDQYIPGFDNFESGHVMTHAVTGGTPEFLTFDSTRKHLFVSDRFYGRVTEYAYPAGKIVNQYTPARGNDNTQIYGVAVSPASTYF